MSDLVDRARRYAMEATPIINLGRKHPVQPYDAHLKAVAQTVREVSDDEEMVAAAWLHETVENTESTHQDLELEFGQAVAALVLELTGVSKVSDGNSATRMAIDCAHLAQASNRAQTIKLADLIDNLRGMSRKTQDAARISALESTALLEVLQAGDPGLRARAQGILNNSLEKLGISMPLAGQRPSFNSTKASPLPRANLQRVFMQAFSASDLAEALRSFDAMCDTETARQTMDPAGLMVAGVRFEGLVQGYVMLHDLVGGRCGDHHRTFRPDQVVSGDAPLSSVIELLTRHDHVFVEGLGGIHGVVTRADIQKPVMRMWIFGVITILEMNLVARIRAVFPDDSWQNQISETRLTHARKLLEERERRGQKGDLLECMQFADKAQVLLSNENELKAFGFGSRKEAKRVIKDLESLRNNLAHAQDIVTHDWPQIARMARNIELQLRQGTNGAENR